METGQGPSQDPPSSPTRPLRIRKHLSPLRLPRPQQVSEDGKKARKHSSNQRHPPRTSSLLRDKNADASGKVTNRERAHGGQKRSNSWTGQSAPSNAACTSTSDPFMDKSTAQSAVSSFKERYLSGSTEILGDFVPVNIDMALPSRRTEQHTVSCNA